MPHATGRQERAFTLIEVLIVVAIIGLMVSILVPVLSRGREQVRSTACQSNMKQLAHGMFLYVADQKVLPGTHSLFFFQRLFGNEWSRPPGVTWDGARDGLDGFSYSPAYSKPHHLDPEFVDHVPFQGTLFRLVKNEDVYLCPDDKPGKALDTPLGGGGNGRLSYAMNAYIGYKSPEQLEGFRYVADSLDNPLPGGQETRSFKSGQRVLFPTSRFMLLFEEHPFYHSNTSFPEGNFNGLDRIATRHMPSAEDENGGANGWSSCAFLDGHAESRKYPARTEGRALFTEYGQPYFWHQNGPPDVPNLSAFIRRLIGPCPW